MPQANGALGVIDFQDAVLGPVTYDLGSLLRDCYIRWPRERVEDWALGYYELAQQTGILRPDQAGIYLFDDHTIKPFDYTPGEGFAISTFDEVILSQNAINDDLYYGLQSNQGDDL